MIAVIGAGVGGLAAAGALQRAGREVVVFDKARGVGGRCATRRLEGQPMDMGVSWFHGSDPHFLAAFDDFEPDSVVPGWPHRVQGSGPACNPRSLDSSERRFALRDGASAFPKHLARGLNVRLGTRIAELRPLGDRVELQVASGTVVEAEHVVLALPNNQMAELLEPLEATRERMAARFVLGRAAAVACLTVLALYPLDTPDPGFDVCLPELGGALALVAHDSTKRRSPSHRGLVIQATPRWSSEHLEADPEVWSRALLAETAGRIGSWAAAPSAQHAHRWRYARVDPAWALRSPLVLGAGHAKVLLTGESFHPGAGVQGAWLAGVRAAARLLEL